METKIRVLVADANHDFCTLIKNLISAESDMEVVGATDDGLETLALVAELTPDVLIMDLALTKLDGLEVLRRPGERRASARNSSVGISQQQRSVRLFLAGR